MAKASFLFRSRSLRSRLVDAESSEEKDVPSTRCHRTNVVRNDSPSDASTIECATDRGSEGDALVFRVKSEPVQVVEIPSASCLKHGTLPDSMVIGVALGNFSENPLPPLPQEAWGKRLPLTNKHLKSCTSTREDACLTGDERATAKHTGNRWKLLGGLFGKKTLSAPASPFYLLQETSQNSPQPELIVPQHHIETGREKKVQRYRPQKRDHRMDSKLEIKRSQTAPLQRSREKTPAPPPKDRGKALRLQPNGGPLLQVEIPNVEMERYSVMFGSLIKPAHSSSLLVRRQGTMEKLKADENNDHQADHPQRTNELVNPTRRAISPSPAGSISSSLFPSTPPNLGQNVITKPILKPSPLYRSATTPAASSPIHAHFESPNLQEQNHLVVMLRSPALSSRALARSPELSWTSDDFHFSPSSADIEFSDGTDSAVKTLDLSVPPQDGRVSPPQITVTGASIQAPSTNLESPQSEIIIPSPEALAITPNQPNPADGYIRNTSEVSVARQISISRRQRELLDPIVPRTARQPMQPRLVDVQHSHGSRKSHHALVEQV